MRSRRFTSFCVLLACTLILSACALSTQLPNQYYEDLNNGVEHTTAAFTFEPATPAPQEETAPIAGTAPTGPAVIPATEAAETIVLPSEPATEHPTVPAAEPEQPAVETFPVQPADTVMIDPSGWSKDEIVSAYVNAVNKTKAVMDTYTAHHTEAFVADITHITGGDVVKGIANSLLSGVVKPSDEDLSFAGGRTVTGEGANIDVLLPKNKSCTLSSAGVTSASAVSNGDGSYNVTLTLLPESVDMTTVPVHNASAIGYLDVSSIDISFMTVTSCDITYGGSTITARINKDGLVSQATYVLNLTVNGAAKAGFISGEATFDGYEQEDWLLPW
ncbi:MAG: hypothetical protein K6C36_09090 [Clostridia bacterium]|nr:hypothetical protein [Clostridia bacterium]